MFGVRLMSSAVLVVLALVFLLSGGPLLGAGMLALSLIACRELMRACQVEENGTFGALEGICDAGIVLYYPVMILTGDFRLGMGCLVLTLLALLALYVFRFPHYCARQVMTAFFCAFYPSVLFCYLYLTRELAHGIYLVWLIFISSWICDTCAYLAGMAFGRHKLAPVLSPKKSVEGAVGGVVGSAVVGALFSAFLLAPASGRTDVILPVALISAAGAVISQVGDLAASAIKRNHEIKDYGKLIPGHGGVMDRFDSVLFTAPVIYYLSLLLL